MNEKLTLTQEWDKTFPKSGKVDHSKVTFHNRYGITLAADRQTAPAADADNTDLLWVHIIPQGEVVHRRLEVLGVDVRSGLCPRDPQRRPGHAR